MAIFRAPEQRGVLSPALRVRLDGPEEERASAEEKLSQILVISIPELFTCDSAPKSPQDQAPDDPRQRIVYPDQRVGAAPDDVTDCAIVPVSNPRVAGERLLAEIAEGAGVQGRPVRTPVKRVQFDVRRSQQLSDLAAECGLARSAGPDDRNSLHSCPGDRADAELLLRPEPSDHHICTITPAGLRSHR